MKRFEISVPETVLKDLNDRLRRTRWPAGIGDLEWELGTRGDYLAELTEYWLETFEWRKSEASLNQFSQFKTEIDGLNVHFIYERGKGPHPKPLLLTHGWPSTFFEMTKIIPRLTDPARFGGDPRDSFDVIVPSLPGFGFSDAAERRGFSSWDIADRWAKLMQDVLGYRQFFAHGGDVGSGVTTRLAILHPDAVRAIHLLAVVDPVLSSGSRPLTESEQQYLDRRKRWWEDEGAYWHLQQTRPQTLAYSLTDSPVGLASWIIEKYRAWSDCRGDIESRFTKDELLTNIMLYWITGTIGSSMRLYYENWGKGARLVNEREYVRVPTAVALTREAIEFAPPEWTQRLYNVVRRTEFSAGGHFMALEEPELLVRDLQTAFRNR